MSTNITPFAFGDKLVRVITDENGDPWFVAKDVCRALGYSEESNPARLLQAVPEEWKGLKQIHTLGGIQEIWSLSEQGLYFFLGRSDKPGAFPFQKWMAGDVLPTLRKTGTYTMPTPKPEIIEPASLKPIEQIPERLSRQMPDIQLSEEALYLRPATQKGYFRYTIRAFGFGDTEESWLIQCGAAPSFSALNEILWGSVYTDAEGREHQVRSCMIDAMGGRTKEVYSWAIRHRGRVFPWQGVRSLSQPYTPAPQEYFPDIKGNKIRIPGGLNLWRCDTTFFKSDLSHKLSIAPDDPGAFHLHSNENGHLEQYARELCAEVWDDEKQGWENPSHKDNHFWDCEVMTLALAHILNVRHMRRPEESRPAKPQRRRERDNDGSLYTTSRR